MCNAVISSAGAAETAAAAAEPAPAAAGTADAWGTGVCLTCLGVLQGEFGALCEEVAKDVGESGFEVLRAGDLKLCFAVPAAVLVREKSACLRPLPV